MLYQLSYVGSRLTVAGSRPVSLFRAECVKAEAGLPLDVGELVVGLRGEEARERVAVLREEVHFVARDSRDA
ncbi:MAG: hypothetical protein ACRDNH_01640 [Gaiellaceae bacterium]